MAKGGVFQAMGKLWRWTIWGLAAILVVAMWFGWSNRGAGPEGDVVAEAEAPSVEEVGDLEVTLDEPAEAGAAEAVEEAVADVETAVEDVVDAAEDALEEAEESVRDLADDAEQALGEVRDALEGGRGDADDAPAASLNEADGTDGVVGREEADLNILPPELSEIRIPGDDATYSLMSLFRRDDGAIEVVSARIAGGETTQTIRLVTCAPLAVGVVAEGDGPRNDDPELERIPLGSAAATIAALACGAMN